MNIYKLLFKAQILVFVIVFLFSLYSACWAATYYVNATNGNDSNNGLSETTAWKTIAKVNASKFNILSCREKVVYQKINTNTSILKAILFYTHQHRQSIYPYQFELDRYCAFRQHSNQFHLPLILDFLIPHVLYNLLL